MSQIFDSLKALVSPEMISKAASFLGEKDSKVSNATSSIIPGLLGSLLKKGNTTQLQNTLEDACRSNILSDITGIFNGNMTEDQRSIGDRFMQAALGNKSNEFTSAVATDSGISNASASKLTQMLSLVTAGFLGKKMTSSNEGLSGIMADLGREKNSFLGMIPSKLSNTLGLSSWVNADKAYATGITDKNNKPKKNNSWMVWLILIILLLLLFFWWRSCRRSSTVDRVTDRVEMRDTVNTRAVTTSDMNRNDARDRDYEDIDLNNGMTIRAYSNGAERGIVNFLKGDDYKNWDNNTLKNKWFGFDDVRFEFNSTNKLMEGTRQLDNIASIMKSHEDTKIVIGGFADVVGGEEANQEVSKERADYVKSVLVSKGISASRISTEGFGERFAEHSADESDRARSEDRTIAIRFVK